MSRLPEYLAYHDAMDAAGDIDPSYPMLRYVCDRFELTMEQRFWLAYLYSLTYCGPSVFFVYNDFPDFENVDDARMERWWAANKCRMLFQSDRLWVRSRDQFCAAVRSYRRWVGRGTQAGRFEILRRSTPGDTYDAAYASAGGIFQMGRFGLFLFLEAVHVVTGFPMEPTGLDLANAESSRNGLCYAIGRDAQITGPETGRTHLGRFELADLSLSFEELVAEMKRRPHVRRAPDVWAIETTLCAFKKHKRNGKRWVGYYLDRQAREIDTMERNVTDGVAWRVLREFRQEVFGR